MSDEVAGGMLQRFHYYEGIPIILKYVKINTFILDLNGTTYIIEEVLDLSLRIDKLAIHNEYRNGKKCFKPPIAVEGVGDQPS